MTNLAIRNSLSISRKWLAQDGTVLVVKCESQWQVSHKPIRFGYIWTFSALAGRQVVGNSTRVMFCKIRIWPTLQTGQLKMNQQQGGLLGRSLFWPVLRGGIGLHHHLVYAWKSNVWCFVSSSWANEPNSQMKHNYGPLPVLICVPCSVVSVQSAELR